jgi:mannose-6-phosphate isomerase-like protein (cupin superfamily)
MPVFRSGDQIPAWCELRHFEIVHLKPDEERSFDRTFPKEKLIVLEGECDVTHLGEVTRAQRKAKFDLQENDPPLAVKGVAGLDDTIVVRLCGTWGDVTGGSGIFQVVTPKPEDRIVRGDAVTYPKTTSFDNHFHDCDEYWIVYQGRGVVISEGITYEVQPGDCIATGMGHHHDFPHAYEPVRSAFFETTIQGAKRHGHLWDYQHGLAQPDPVRV